MAHVRHDSRAVANKIIRFAIDDGRPLTPLQIIKLVYFCHGWMLALYGKPLFRDYVQAWKYGPVVPNVYHALKHYGGDPVTSEIPLPEEQFDEDEEYLIGQVYAAYGHLHGIRLSQLTHAPGTPWDVIWSQTGSNSVIPNELIREHYAGMIREDDAEDSSPR